jgi:hypothetical protein
MTFKQALQEWREFERALSELEHGGVDANCPHVTARLPRGGICTHCGYQRRRDRPADRLSWVTFVDHLARDGRISEEQASSWDQPPENK